MSDRQARETQADTRDRGRQQRLQVEKTAREHRGLIAAFYAARRAAKETKS